MRIADVRNRRTTPATPAARVARNRWRDLESAPPQGWTPHLTSAVIAVSVSSLTEAQAAAAASTADILVFCDPARPPDAALVARLTWWQHVCDYAVSVATCRGATPNDWLATYHEETDYLNRAGYEAFRGAAAGTFAVPRNWYDAAGGIDVGAGSGWQLELAYRLAQRGAAFIADAEAAEDRPPADDVTAELQELVPLLPERRPDWKRPHRVPALHVVVDCETAPDAAEATIEGVLGGEFRDLALSVIGATSATGGWSEDPRVALLDVAESFRPDVPFRLELPAGCLLQPFSIRRMLNRMRESQLGLYQALVEPNVDTTRRTIAVRLLRTAAVGRSRFLVGERGIDDAIDELFGSTWVDGRRFGLHHAADAAQVQADDELDEVEVEADDDEDD